MGRYGNAVWTEEYSGLTVEFYADDDPCSPREEWDNMGVIWADHRNYNLGDKNPDAGLGWDFHQCRNNYANDGKYDEWEAIAAALLRTYPGTVVMPVYFHEYDGSMTTGKPVRHIRDIAGMRDAPGYARYGWGKVDGVVFCLPEAIYREMQVKVITADVRERVVSNLEGEVETYSAYSSGQVYGVVIRDPETGKPLDDYAVWGYYGTEDAEDAAKGMAFEAADMLAERRAEVGQAAAGLAIYSAA